GSAGGAIRLVRQDSSPATVQERDQAPSRLGWPRSQGDDGRGTLLVMSLQTVSRMHLLLSLALLAMLPPAAVADEPLKPHRLHVPSREGDLNATLWVRDGFSISVFAALPGTLRIIAEAPTGELVASEQWEG